MIAAHRSNLIQQNRENANVLTGGITFEDPYDIFEARFIVNAKRVCAALAVVALGLGAHDLIRARPHAAHAAFASAQDLDAPAQKRAAAAVIPQKQNVKERKTATAVAPREIAKPAVVASVAVAPQPMAQAKPKAHEAEIIVADSVAVAIPFAEKVVVAAAPAPAPAAPQVSSNVAANVTKAASPLVAEFAEARHLDAVEAAMGSTTAMATATPADMATLVTLPQQAAAATPVEARLVNAPFPRAKPGKLASLMPAAVVPMPKPAPILSAASPVTAHQNALPATVSVLPRPAPRPRATPVAETIAQPPASVMAAAPAPAPAAAPAATVQLASIDPEALAIGNSAAPLVSQISLPATIKVLPPPAPGVPPPSPAQRLHLEGASRAKAEKCLSNAIYFEARDQPYQGQVAVAQVVMNRVFSGVYPHDVCGVIYQNANRHLACQFTFACDGKRKVINERAEWARARRIAKDTLDGVLYVQAVGTATHYHANYVHPNWVREMKRFAREGEHLFYRPIAWGNGSNEPRWSRAQKKKK
jgi:hypothetical protein